uniref:Enoyl-CoA hydratase/carnithine racemase n=1 Tax=Candidatus Kentrum sp. LFY TaxID=2126342 RepID=A0A450X4C1_9GAMM|nr:MAG: Enoyl-CoA hydratase/carnithine racemase [Candidatus Kentron sp. LFY]
MGVVTGAGGKVFCAGADVAGFPGRSYEDGLDLPSRRLFDSWAEVKEGFLPGMAIFLLPKYVGFGVARRLLFSGEKLSAQQAAGWEMIDRLCEAEEFEPTIRESCDALMPIHPEVLQNTRRLLNESFATSPEDAIGHFLAVQNLCLAKLDRKGGAS